MAENLISKDIKEGITTLTLNRPKAMNALNVGMVNAMGDQLAKLRFDPSIRVVIITGAGEKAFCAGADLKGFAEGRARRATSHQT